MEPPLPRVCPACQQSMDPGFTAGGRLVFQKTPRLPGIIVPGNEVLVGTPFWVKHMPAWLCRTCRLLLIDYGNVF